LAVLGACGSICFAAAAPAGAALPEFSVPFPKTFTVSSGTSTFRTVSGNGVKCASDTGVGEMTGAQSGWVQLTFQGCKVKTKLCNTPGLTPGTVGTSMLAIKMNYISKPKKQVGWDLIPLAGGPVAELGCTSALFGEIVGSVIGRVLPINTTVTPPVAFELRFVQTAGIQKFTKLESQPLDFLETNLFGPTEQTGLMSIESVLFTEPVLLSA
jgi:hypothetical protein